MNELGIAVLRFSDEQVLKDMENVIRAVEFIFGNMKNTLNPPPQRGELEEQ
jgi:very-short-patch-repair endonuclease